MALRQHVFSATRFQWQQLNGGRPSRMFGTPALDLLETPWQGGTTQDLLNRMIQDADLAGNCYQYVDTSFARLGGDGGRELVRLRPDWVEIVREPRVLRGGQVGYRKLGYLYTEGGPLSGADPVVFGPEELSHFAPIPDPLANWRGMSWLTPVIRDVQADGLMTTHKRRFFENGATPNMIVKYPPEVAKEKILAMKQIVDSDHTGAEQAYKTMHIGGGADVTVVGKDFQQMTFREVQGLGETRIAAAAGTPPVVVGLSEGMQGSSLNAGNYGQARRRMADATMHPLWQNAAGSLALLIASPARKGESIRLWYDARDIPFLREDEKDAAEIAQMWSSSARTLIDAGFKPETVVAALDANDHSLLEHSGLFSVQLQPAGSKPPAATPPAIGA
jgi:phage portal protein BeeE